LGSYIIRRILKMIPAFLLMSVMIAGLLRLLPGDVVTIMAGELGYADDSDDMRELLGLNQPFYRQYLNWMGGVFTGDFGVSLWNHRPVMSELAWRLPMTLELAAFAMLINIGIGIPIGILAATRQDTWIDHLSRSVAILAIAAPTFWIATMVLVFPASWFGWTPSTSWVPLTEDPVANFKVVIVPALILGFAFQGRTVRLLRAMLLEVMRQDYIRTAWAKGLNERVIVSRHALKNALIPVVTLLALEVPLLLGGTVIIEQIFNLPGVGRYMLDLLLNRDFVPVQTIVLLMAGVVMVLNLLVDISYAWLDPRIRYK
jgi:peptide/nickel transport system permease protein